MPSSVACRPRSASRSRVPIGPGVGGPELRERLEDQVALVLGPGEVAVRELVPVACVRERLVAVELLHAGLEVGAGERVLHAVRDVHGEPAHVVDHADEAVEVGVDHVRDLDADRGADRVGLEARAAERVRGVDLVGAVAGDRQRGVARQVEHRRLVQRRVHADEVDRVPAGDGLAGPAVVADHEEEHRLVRGGRVVGVRGLGDREPTGGGCAGDRNAREPQRDERRQGQREHDRDADQRPPAGDGVGSRRRLRGRGRRARRARRRRGSPRA